MEISSDKPIAHIRNLVHELFEVRKSVADEPISYENGIKTAIEDSTAFREHKTEYQYDQDGDLIKISEYEWDENGSFESSPYYTELYVYQ